MRPRAVLALEDGTVFEGRSFGRAGEVDGGGGLQHRPLRLPGGADRPLLRRPDRHHDLPSHRQLRGQPRGRRVGAAPGGGLHRARGLDRGLVVARLGGARPLPRRARDRGDQRDRHPGAHPPPPHPRGQARRRLRDRPRSRVAGRQGARLAVDGRARPGPRGHLREALDLRPAHGGEERGRAPRAGAQGDGGGPPPGRRGPVPGGGLRLRDEAQHPAQPGGRRLRA